MEATKHQTEEHVRARQAEVEAAKRYHNERTYENRDAYRKAMENAEGAHWKEINHYNENGGRGMTPGSYQAPKVPPAPPGWEPLPPRQGEPGFNGPGGPSAGRGGADPGAPGGSRGNTLPLEAGGSRGNTLPLDAGPAPNAPGARPRGPGRVIEPLDGQFQPGANPPAPGRVIEPINGREPPPPTPTPPPPRQSDSRLAEVISHYSTEHANAHNEYIAATNRVNADPSPENRLAYDRANTTLENAKRAEAAAWFHVGGDNFPPMSRPGALPPPPALNIPPAQQPPTTPNNTLAMGLGALAGTVQRGP